MSALINKMIATVDSTKERKRNIAASLLGCTPMPKRVRWYRITKAKSQYMRKIITPTILIMSSQGGMYFVLLF